MVHGHQGPVLKRDQLLLKNVQRHATKLVSCLKTTVMKIDWGFSIYQVFTIGVPEETWSKLGNICTDSIVSTGCLYRVIQTPPQEDIMKLRKERCLKRTRRNFFRHRVVNRWNMLTDNIVTSPSVNIFKNRWDAFWHVHKCEQSDDFPRTNTRQDQLTGY